MRFVCFRLRELAAAEIYRVGELMPDGRIADLTHLISDSHLRPDQVLSCFDPETRFLELAATGGEKRTVFERSDVIITSPVPRPGKIICIGLNYRDHAEESNMPIPASPIVFSKFSSCVVGPGEAIVLPDESDQVDYEAELAFVIGKRAAKVSADDAIEHVFGYTNFNDVSARDLQFADGQWQRGKSCDTFAPMGEYIATREEIADPHGLRIQFRLNGRTLQDSSTGQLIFRIPQLIEFLSRSITLEPGDVIATGTPPGVGFARKPPVFMKDGDVAEVEIEGLGILSNPVRRN